MNKMIHRIAGLVMALVMILGNTVNTRAADNAYYVSPTGSDTNPGTAAAPFKTFAKANSMLTPGSTLYIYAGVYNQQLKITKSGTSSAGIAVQSVGGTAVIDRQRLASAGLDIRASFVTVSGLAVKNSSSICVNLAGSRITVNGLFVYTCGSHGIQANNSTYIKILNSRVFNTVTSNAARNLSGGWGSAIKVRLSNSVLIQGNTIYRNYGEGLGLRGVNITVRSNTVYDNFSVNIYSNSENVLIERNFVYCTPNSGFERSGQPAVGIGMGEEYYDGWGARLKNNKVINNIVAYCRHGVRYTGAEGGVTGAGLKSATIAYNTLYGSTSSALSIVYESAQSGSLIANNIIWQAGNKLTAIDNPTGLTFHNNLWKVLPPAAFRGPGDRVGDPRFVDTPGYTAASYIPSSSSPAAGAAANISIYTDYFSKVRGPTFDIGSVQFASGNVSTNTQVMSSVTVEELTTTLTPASTAVQTTSTLPPATSQVTESPVAPTSQPTNTSLPPTLVVASPTSLPPTSAPTQALPTATAQPTQTAAASAQETTYDNKHASFVYSTGWVEEGPNPAIERSYARTSTNGASVTFQFTGQSFSLIYKGGPSYRKMDVYIDGVLVGTIDQRKDTSTYKARWDFPGTLTAGQHTLKLVFVTTSSSTNGSVDAVIVR